MMNLHTYRLLNEALGFYSLGITAPTNLGIQSNLPGLGEAGMDFGGKDKKKPKTDDLGGSEIPMGDEDGEGEGEEGGENPFAGAEGGEEGGENPFAGAEGGEDDLGGDEGGENPFGGDEGGEGSLEDRIDSLEAKIDQLLATLGGGEAGGMGDEMGGMGDEMGALDHDDDLGGEEGEEGPMPDLDGEEGDEDDDDEENPFGKKKADAPMGGAFMKRMAKEGKGEDKDEDGGKKSFGKFKINKDKGKEDKKGGKGEGPSFLMKKKCSAGGMMDKQSGKPMQFGCKGCSKGAKKCKNCSAKMKKENNEYAPRPQGYDPSEDAWWRSIKSQLSATNVNQKFDDGMKDLKAEDLLLPSPGQGMEAAPGATQPGPGEPGYAPSGRVGSDTFDLTAEAVADILKRLQRLEKGQ